MKKTKWQLACVICQLIFMFVVPVLCLWLEYGNNAFVSVKYKVSITGVAFVLLFFVLSKRFWLDGALGRLKDKITYIETQALQITDQKAIQSTKKAYKRYKYIYLIYQLIIPLLLLVGLTIIIKALEEQALKMYNVFLWSTISFGVGVIFKVLEIHGTKFTHEVKTK